MVEEMPGDLLFRHPVKLSEVTKNLVTILEKNISIQVTT
jgi:hypothetical protein